MAALASSSHWLLSFPIEGGNPLEILQAIRANVKAKSGEGAPIAEVVEFAVPGMKVGTFEGLLALADDLGRADTFCEGVVRKTERQVADSAAATRAAASAAAPAGSSSAAPAAAPLLVHGTPVADFVRSWRWDVEAWDPRDPLPDLVKRLLAAAERVDAELRSYAGAYGEKRTALTALERRRDGSLLVRGLEDVITPAKLASARADFVPPSSEYLKTYVVVVPGAAEEAFLASYEGLAPRAAEYGEPGRRGAVLGSPIVPGSARRIEGDADGYVLYLLAGLKKYDAAIRAAAKDARWTVRDFTLDPAAAGSGARAIAELRVEVEAALAALREQAGRKYSEAMALWLHLKAVRVFVESVLRYGLPAQATGAAGAGRASAPFIGVLVNVAARKQRAALACVMDAWHGGAAAAGEPSAATPSSSQRAMLDTMYGGGGAAGGAGKGATADPVIPGVTDGAGGLPFVALDVEYRSDTSGAAGR